MSEVHIERGESGALWRETSEQLGDIKGFRYAGKSNVVEAAGKIAAQLERADSIKALLKREWGRDPIGSRQAGIEVHEREAAIAAEILDIVVPLPDGQDWESAVRDAYNEAKRTPQE